MERTEWPSPAYLQELREGGIIAYSHFSTACISALAVYLTMWQQLAEWRTFLEGYRAKIIGPAVAGAGINWEALRLLTQQGAVLAVAPLAAAAICGLGFGLLQTRFFFHPAELSLDAQRLNPLRLAAFFTGLKAFSWACLLAPLVIMGALFLMWYYAALVLSPLSGGLPVLLGVPRRVCHSGAMLVVPGLIALAAAAWLVRRMVFMHTHRMTKQEVLAEEKEQ